MKPNFSFRLLTLSVLFLYICFGASNLYAENAKSKHITTEAGKLASLISSSDKFTIESLTITGDLNGDDILFLREMTGRDFNGNATDGKLGELDLSNANIVAGGSPYYKQYFNYSTEANTIGEHMFENSTITKIILPKTVTIIKGNSFIASSKLEDITIPENVTSIGDLAFKGCSSLKEFSFPKVQKIAGEVLSGCANLLIVHIPSTVTSIDYMAFANCNKLSEIRSAVEDAPSIGYNAFQNVPMQETKVYVPQGCANIYKIANGWSNFTNIIEEGDDDAPFVANLTQAGTLSSLVGNKKYAIKDLIVSGPLNGDDILCIREMAGRDVNGLETSGNLVNLIMPTATIVEGGSPYYYNYSEGLTTKGNTFSNYFFAKCKLEHIILPTSLKLIEGGAFSNCWALVDEIDIPEGVTRIGEYAFEACTQVKTFNLPSTLIDGTGTGYKKDAIGSNAFYGCHALTSISIPENVTKILGSTFQDNFELKEIDLPSTITLIDGYAFSNCQKLQDLRISATTPPTVRYGAFSGVSTSSCTIHVPVGTSSLYKDADGWMDFSNIVENIETNIKNIDIPVDVEANIYSINGMKVNHLQKGINIVKMADGTTRKVVIK